MRRLLILFYLALASAVNAQTPVLQSGNVTPGHPVAWVTDGIVQDGGTPTNPNLTGVGVQASGPGVCQLSGPTNGPFNRICLDVTTTGFSLDLDSFGGATGGLTFKINGTNYPFPFTVGGIVGPGSTTIGHLVTWNNITGSLVADGGTPGANGTFGSPSKSPVITVDARGLTTSVSTNPIRQVLTTTASYYVNGNSGSTATCGAAGAFTCAAGSDSNDCLTPGTACLTAQHAINLIANTIDIAGQIVTVYLAHNAGTANYAVSCVIPFVGTSVVLVRGDSNARDATVIVPPANGYSLQIKDGCTLDYAWMGFGDNVTMNGAGHGIVGGSGNAGHLDMSNVNFGALSIGTQVTAGYLGSITATGPILISAGAPLALNASNGGTIDFGTQTVTISGTPAFSTAFAFFSNSGIIVATNSTFSGSATGKRCTISGPLNLSGFNPDTILPGNTQCTGGSQGTQWTTFAPAPSCGSAQFAVNAARYKVIEAKTTHVEIDFTISTLGSCTNSITVSLPNTANLGAMLSGSEQVNSNATVACRTVGVTATVACLKNLGANFTGNDRIQAMGTYENQ